ncbi:MAG: substrate-binding domain-containing protein [Prevotellaceae bacterium]|nr:substrate-binding domain-containing protein [Prevotellaceae bacterium]
MNERVRIKDIAELSGVSVGTVDRVLHNRPSVSPAAKKKVEEALEKMNYKPNVYASALAMNKQYLFYLILPQHDHQAYWQEIEEGAEKATIDRKDFQITLETYYYNRYDSNSFTKLVKTRLKKDPDGVILVPSDIDTTRKYTETLHAANIPFILLDSYMPDLKPLSFYGLDSFNSGYFAAKMFMMLYHTTAVKSKEKCVMLMRQVVHGRVASKQQANREEGFRHYIIDHFPKIKIIDFEMNEEKTEQETTAQLDAFFKKNPDVHHCITFSSKAYIIGEYLQNNNRRNIHVMGYDLVTRNEKCVQQGSIDFIIAQHSYRQGYYCVKTLFDAVVLQQSVKAINYMPIVLLCKENADFYQRTEL